MDKTKEVVDYVVAKLNGLGEALSPYAKEGWEILIKQQYVKFFQLAGALFLVSVICLIMALLARRYYKACCASGEKRWDHGDEYLQVMTIVPTVVSCMAGAAVIALSIATTVSISLLVNPKYYAIETLLKSGGSKVN